MKKLAILTIMLPIALPKRTPIFSAAPPVSSTGCIIFLIQSQNNIKCIIQ